MIYISLGSNLGDRSYNLAQARTMLSVALNSKLLLSPIIETEPTGTFKGTPKRFLNQVAAFSLKESPISPERLLEVCKMIERTLGRPMHEAEFDAAGKRVYHDRTIDLDILLFDDVRMHSPNLTIPHAALSERPFLAKLIKEVSMSVKPVADRHKRTSF